MKLFCRAFPERLAWLAGFFEGEGNVYSGGRKGTFQISISSIDKDALQEVKRLAGGSLKGPFKTSHPYKLNGKTKPFWRWRLCGAANCLAFWIAIRYWLSARRKTQWKNAVTAWKTTKIARPGRKIPPMKSCYLAGKMRGLPEYGFPIFAKGAKKLRRAGWQVISPAELDIEAGVIPNGDLNINTIEVFKRDFAAIKQSSAVVLLPNWKTSEGARLEKLFAERIGAKILTFQNAIKS